MKRSIREKKTKPRCSKCGRDQHKNAEGIYRCERNHKTDSIEADEPEPKIKERAIRGMAYKHVKAINVNLKYKRVPFDGANHELRRYNVGAIQVAFIHIYEPETMQHGNVQVFINSKHGNGGEWFDNINEARRFIISELKREK